MQQRRNKAAAKHFFRKLLKPAGFAPRIIVTDKLKSYGAAKKEILESVEHRLWVKHSAFYQLLNRYAVISILTSTNKQLQNTEKRCASGSKVGDRLQG